MRTCMHPAVEVFIFPFMAYRGLDNEKIEALSNQFVLESRRRAMRRLREPLPWTERVTLGRGTLTYRLDGAGAPRVCGDCIAKEMSLGS